MGINVMLDTKTTLIILIAFARYREGIETRLHLCKNIYITLYRTIYTRPREQRLTSTAYMTTGFVVFVSFLRDGPFYIYFLVTINNITALKLEGNDN